MENFLGLSVWLQSKTSYR